MASDSDFSAISIFRNAKKLHVTSIARDMPSGNRG